MGKDCADNGFVGACIENEQKDIHEDGDAKNCSSDLFDLSQENPRFLLLFLMRSKRIMEV